MPVMSRTPLSFCESTAAVIRQLGAVQLQYRSASRALVVTPDIRKVLGKVSDMRCRWGRGDLHHTQAEYEALTVLSEWLVKKFHDLNGTEPPCNTWSRG